jgi:competence protein ComEC
LWGGREVTALLLASLIAGLATMPYAAYHFHRIAPYGVIANLLAMPVVSAMVMPMGILGVLTMPFGFDGLFWKLMGAGLDWMIGVALWVTNLPGSVGYLPAFGVGPLLLGTAGILLLCLLRTPLRWSGAALGIAACLWALAAPRPDVLMAADGQSAAIRGPGGRLLVLMAGRDTFAVKEWLAADGDPRKPADAGLKQGVRCDAIGCTAALANGRLVTFARLAEAFEEDCTRAAAVLSPRDAPAACRATLIDRRVWRAQGATALFWNGSNFAQAAARPANVDRPWARAVRSQRTDVSENAPSSRRPAIPDATPPTEAIEADD